MAKKLLIVDDALSVRQLVAFTLKNAGYEVIEASNGEEGANKAKTNKVDMVITDLNMPVKDGISMIRDLRAMQEYKFTPIVMLTTESQEGKKQEGKQAGATAWIVKPFSPDQLLSVVKRVLG